MRRKERVEHLVSAGGVVYRTSNSGIEVVVCGRNSPPVWGLPKGTPVPDETHEQTALREVEEETGLKVAIEGFIDAIEYWFIRSQNGVRCHKSVFFYLMSTSSGDLSLHDREFDTVRWAPVGEALRILTYANEARMVQNGVSMVPREARTG